MKFLSVCSGIEAASVAWKPLGWEPVGFSEVEPFPCSVLAHHYPTVPNYGDLTQWEKWIDNVEDFELLAGGTPCQGFSVAGRRGGMDDPRSRLALDFLGIAGRRKPRWVVWENVPGVFSSGQGQDFEGFVKSLSELGYGVCWRVLDAQYFGLAQRRKRVFVVGYLGDWRPAAAVLLEPESLSGNPPPSREAGEGTAAETAPSLRGGGPGLSRTGDSRGQDPVVAHALRAEGHDASEDGTGRGVPLWPVVSPAIKARDHKGPSSDDNGDAEGSLPVAMNLRGREGGAMPELDDVASPRAADGGSSRSYVCAFARNTRDEVREMEVVGASAGEPGMKQTSYARIGMAVRRLTPRECERLQGFPDDYTLVPHRGKPAADGPRYKALGNSWATPCARWIGERIAKFG